MMLERKTKKLVNTLSSSSVLFGVLLALLFAGLQPFNFIPMNDTHWYQMQNGIRFGGYGQVTGTGSLGEIASGSNEFTLELLVSSYKGRRASIETVVSVLRTDNKLGLSIEIWTIDLVVGGWLKSISHGTTTYDRLFCGQVFETKADRFITITSGRGGLSVYVDGIAQRTYPDLAIAPGNLLGRLLLGQPPEAHQQWQGGIKALALFDRALPEQQVVADYELWKNGKTDDFLMRGSRTALFRFNERRGRLIRNEGNVGGVLEIPEKFVPVRPAFLKSPTDGDLRNWSDIVLNVIGFVPWGVSFAIFLQARRTLCSIRTIALSTLTAFGISLFIEILQVYLPSRDSSLLDLIMNTFGGLIGAGLAMVLRTKLLGATE